MKIGWVRHRFWRTPLGIAVVVLVALVAVLAIVELSNDDGGRPSVDHDAVAPLDGRSVSGFDLLSGATSVSVAARDLGGDLYRIATPADSALYPQVVGSPDRVELQLGNTGGTGPSHVDVLLSSKVRWSLRLAGGAAAADLDLTQADVAGVDMVAGMTRVSLALGAPHGTVPVRLAGGASDFVVSTPAGTKSQVQVGGGAGSVVFNGSTAQGVSAGRVFSDAGWATATDRYDVNLASGVSVVTVSARS